MSHYDMIIVGAGPSGLSCAIQAKKSGLSCLVIDKGTVADAIRRFPVSMTFFSTPELLEIGGVPFLTSGFRPTRVEALRYYQHVVTHFALEVRQRTLITGIHPVDEGFRVETPAGSLTASYVVAATGYFDDPSPFDVKGSDLPKVRRYYSEPFECFGMNVAVVGGKNSAVETALDLHRHGANVTLIHRGPALSEGVKYWILPDIQNRLQKGEIKGYFNSSVSEIRAKTIVIEGPKGEEIPNDIVFVMIGYSPGMQLLASAGVQFNGNSRIPQHNPETMETNVKGLYVVGSIAAGRFNNRIFIENGRAHGGLVMKSVLKRR